MQQDTIQANKIESSVMLPVTKIISSVDPLNDTAFKLALRYYDDFYNDLVMFTTGKEAGSTTINAIGSETTLYAGGKTTLFDHIKNTIRGLINMEGQNDRYKFPIQRQIFHWAILFASQLKGGDSYKDVKPVTVIVFYKDRGKAKPLIQKACATGDLLDHEGTQYMNLIAVNTAKWFAAEDRKFKNYLALLHYGLDEEVLSENGIDINDKSFQEARDMMMHCCAQHAVNEAKEKGDKEMKKMMSVYFTEKGIEIGTEKGIEIGTEKGIEIGTEKGIEIGTERGIEKGRINVYYEEMQLTPEEISKKMSVPLERVYKTLQLQV